MKYLLKTNINIEKAFVELYLQNKITKPEFLFSNQGQISDLKHKQKCYSLLKVKENFENSCY